MVYDLLAIICIKVYPQIYQYTEKEIMFKAIVSIEEKSIAGDRGPN
jgi:hypothetical protein